MKRTPWILFLMLILIVLAAFGNPSERAHFEKFKESKHQEIQSYLKEKNIPLPHFLIEGLPTDYVIDAVTDYESSVLFSRLAAKESSETVTFGLFWTVFEM